MKVLVSLTGDRNRQAHTRNSLEKYEGTILAIMSRILGDFRGGSGRISSAIPQKAAKTKLIYKKLQETQINTILCYT